MRLPGRQDHEPVTFLVDTGCSASCILPDDVIRLGIEHEALPTVTQTIITANGPVGLKLLKGVDLILPVLAGLLDNKRGYLRVPMESLAVLPPNLNHTPLPKELVFSLLGMDVLRLFPRWAYKKDSLILENDEVVGLNLSFKL